MAKTFTAKSPAKINIGLRVLSKRADGYHNIETIFYPVKIYDEIRIVIEKTEEKSTGCIVNVKTKPDTSLSGKNNICYKAVELFLDTFKIKNNYKIDISIQKKIPAGAGLGGGSSDAASTLNILSKFFNKTNKAKLKNVALELGSDVPFFLSGKPSYAELRGEKLTSLPDFKIRYKILIVNPGIHVSTKEAYGGLKMTRNKPQIRQTLNKFKKFKISDSDKFLNDFERVVFKKYPQIKDIKDKMYEFDAVFSLMSGSGSTVYGFFDTKKIKAAEKFFRSLGYKVFNS